MRRLFLIFLQPVLLCCFEPIFFIKNDLPSETLINSVSFHPHKNLFCVTFTHQNQVGLYQITDDDRVEIVQMLTNPKGNLCFPQNAIFSPNGQHLLIVNWPTSSFNLYSAKSDGRFSMSPRCVIPCKLSEKGYRPHGMCFSSDGSYLAVVYACFENAPWAIYLYRVHNLDNNKVSFEPCSFLQKEGDLKGVPKGVTFSPDGSSLIITFTVTDSIAIFSVDLEKGLIGQFPEQEITGFSRPEDIAFSPDGKYCAVSNSSGNTIAFYLFDKLGNRFISDVPCMTLGTEDYPLLFPHGLSFSSDGKYFAITQFGLVQVDSIGYITSWGDKRVEGIHLFKTE